MRMDGQMEGVVSWQTFVMGQCALCRQDVRLMRLQNESNSGVTEFGLRTFDGPGMCGRLAFARTHASD